MTIAAVTPPDSLDELASEAIDELVLVELPDTTNVEGEETRVPDVRLVVWPGAAVYNVKYVDGVMVAVAARVAAFHV